MLSFRAHHTRLVTFFVHHHITTWRSYFLCTSSHDGVTFCAYRHVCRWKGFDSARVHRTPTSSRRTTLGLETCYARWARDIWSSGRFSVRTVRKAGGPAWCSIDRVLSACVWVCGCGGFFWVKIIFSYFRMFRTLKSWNNWVPQISSRYQNIYFACNIYSVAWKSFQRMSQWYIKKYN